jgi:hypothetical protein
MALDLFTKRLPSAILKALAALANGAGVLTNNGSGTLSWAAAAATVDTYGAVGSYVLAGANLTATNEITPGNTIAGSSLVAAGISGISDGTFNVIGTSGSALSGTWRAHGYYPSHTANRSKFTLWTRTV